MTNLPAPPPAADESLVGRIADEFTERLNRGESPDVEEYARRYPELADVLRQALAALQIIRPLSASIAPAGGAEPEADLPGTLGDFRLLREVGRGGMGVVYEAEQISLRRRVALKVLPFAATMDARQLQRFKNEAQAAAQMHHTNIVPVYYVGCERGVHFYAMQYIEGRSLADEIAALRASKQAPSGGNTAPEPTTPYQEGQVRPSDGGLSQETAPVAARSTLRTTKDADYFRTVAELGIQAGEALDHAHQLGIIHRDVKPANLLLEGGPGADTPGFRLWVTDFGLAQMRGDTRLTMTGDLVGTLRYMSPEQALAKRVVVDHRTDVYSLGATLYELLTLEPAFRGTDRQELLRQIAFEEPRAPRRLRKSVPAELETIVLKAMEKNPTDRYATAKDVAEDLRRYLYHEPIRARRPTLVQSLRKWGRRHKAAVAAGVVCLLVCLAAGFGSAGYVLAERTARQREAESKVLEALESAERGLLAGNPHNPALIAAVERAEAHLGNGLLKPELRGRVEQGRHDLLMLGWLEDARLQPAAGNKETGLDYAGADELYAQAFNAYGLNLNAMEPTQAVATVRASAIRTHLIAALDHWAFARQKLSLANASTLRDLADLADENPWTRRLREAVTRKDRAALETLTDQAASSQASRDLVNLVWALQSVDSKKETIERPLRQALREHPADFWINFDLGISLLGREPAQAARFFQAALALRPGSPLVYSNLGYALCDQGKFVEAEAACRRAIIIRPDLAAAYNNLGAALRGQGKATEGEAAYRKAIELKPNLPLFLSNLGNALRDQGKLIEAEAACRQAIALDPDRAQAHNILGAVLRDLGKPKEGEAAIRKAITLKPDYAEGHKNLGNALKEVGRLEEAIAEYREALRLKNDYWEAYNDLGNALQDRGEFEAAISEYKTAIRINAKAHFAHHNLGNALQTTGRLQQAIAEHREAIRLKKDFHSAHIGLGNDLRAMGRLDEAIVEHREALRLKADDPVAHYSLGADLQDADRWDEAMMEYREAIRLKGYDAAPHKGLGDVLMHKGQLDEAFAEYQEAIRLKENVLGAHGNLGIIFVSKGDIRRAILEFRAELSIDPNDAICHDNLGHALGDHGQLDAAIAEYREAIRLKKDYAQAHCHLGRALRQKGDFIESLKEYYQGHELGAGRPDWRYPSAQWVRDAERLVELDSKLPSILRGDAQPTSFGERLELARMCAMYKKLNIAAVRFYSKSFAEQPQLAGNLQTRDRYNAACAAAQAGCGQGKDADTIDDKERARLRQQALAWLQADLKASGGLLDKDAEKVRPVVAKTMHHWLGDADFSGVRGEAALAKLPEAERQAWQQLWQEVEELRQRAAGEGKPAGGKSQPPGSPELVPAPRPAGPD